MKYGWELYGEALVDWWGGESENTIRQHYSDGDFVDLPVDIFFREYEDWPDLEIYACKNSIGSVLEIGAGSGSHTYFLQVNGFDITALDIAPGAIQVMQEKGIEKTILGDVYDLKDKKYDTLLMLMNGIGFVEDLAGLDRFLVFAKSLLNPEGQILLDSSDLHGQDLESLYGEDYYGETTLQLEYKEESSPAMRWLYIDAETLREHASRGGWEMEIAFQGDEGRYLARLQVADA